MNFIQSHQIHFPDHRNFKIVSSKLISNSYYFILYRNYLRFFQITNPANEASTAPTIPANVTFSADVFGNNV